MIVRMPGSPSGWGWDDDGDGVADRPLSAQEATALGLPIGGAEPAGQPAPGPSLEDLLDENAGPTNVKQDPNTGEWWGIDPGTGQWVRIPGGPTMKPAAGRAAPALQLVKARDPVTGELVWVPESQAAGMATTEVGQPAMPPLWVASPDPAGGQRMAVPDADGYHWEKLPDTGTARTTLTDIPMSDGTAHRVLLNVDTGAVVKDFGAMPSETQDPLQIAREIVDKQIAAGRQVDWNEIQAEVRKRSGTLPPAFAGPSMETGAVPVLPPGLRAPGELPAWVAGRGEPAVAGPSYMQLTPWGEVTYQGRLAQAAQQGVAAGTLPPESGLARAVEGRPRPATIGTLTTPTGQTVPAEVGPAWNPRTQQYEKAPPRGPVTIGALAPALRRVTPRRRPPTGREAITVGFLGTR